ncbi:MAG: hypothetical protein ACBR23_27000, partial [Microcoleus sp.]
VKQMSSYFIPKARWVSDLKFRLVLTTKYCHKVLADTMPIGLELKIIYINSVPPQATDTVDA